MQISFRCISAGTSIRRPSGIRGAANVPQPLQEIKPRAGGILERRVSLQPELTAVSIPDLIGVLHGVVFGVSFASTRLPFGTGCHPVVVVSKFVQENVQQLKGFHRLRREMTANGTDGRGIDIAGPPCPIGIIGPFGDFDGHIQLVERFPVFQEEIAIPVLNEFSFFGTNGDDSRLIPAHAVGLSRRQQNEFQTTGQFGPVGKKSDETLDIPFQQVMSVSFAGWLPFDRGTAGRIRPEIRCLCDSVLSLCSTVFDSRSRFSLAAFHGGTFF